MVQFLHLFENSPLSGVGGRFRRNHRCSSTREALLLGALIHASGGCFGQAADWGPDLAIFARAARPFRRS